jgi:SAM-dependent methyltransferase
LARQGAGVFDGDVGPSKQLNPDIVYTTPPGRGRGLFNLIGDMTGKRVLDIGCGHAPYRERLEKMGAKWTGLDLAGPGCSIIGDGDHLPFRDGSFDAVLCAAVLEHMPEPDSIMREINRVLTPNGRLFGYVSFLEPFHGMSYFHMSHMGLEHLFFKHGFRPVTIFPSRIGTAYQIECLLFPKPVPVLQPVVGAALQGWFRMMLWANRTARALYHRLRPNAPSDDPSDPVDAQGYQRLLELRFAVGFNFVAIRDDAFDSRHEGYRKLVT